MATVVITEAKRQGDAVYCAGTVDGTVVMIRVWRSYLLTLANKAARAAYVAGLMKAEVDAAAGTPEDVLATVTV